ncbi:hypothetical protein NLI96_g7227 [Meripilus lineatus]|uniref:Uncharacterized protein n=1 Tax=Meripilus lineatus TaxID=2056292 RepID=A0AAD5YD51_9APHY|nr:hypothetical protein NLI96_g7227 [Physisporinus lineatus]
MFATCDSGYVLDMLDEEAETLELNEPSATLNMLFNCLHYPPEPYTEPPKSAKEDFTRVQFKSSPESSIPFPILPPLLRLADKFAFTDELTHCLRSHLSAYVATYPLRVYGYAVELGMDAVAAKASMFLLDPPISSYSAEDMKAVPSAEALQRLVLLHDYRITKLKEILGGESIFPHDYGLCSKHGHKTRNLWEQRKTQVLPKIQAGTFTFCHFGAT